MASGKTKLAFATEEQIEDAVNKATEFLDWSNFYSDGRGIARSAIVEHILFTQGLQLERESDKSE